MSTRSVSVELRRLRDVWTLQPVFLQAWFRSMWPAVSFFITKCSQLHISRVQLHTSPAMPPWVAFTLCKIILKFKSHQVPLRNSFFPFRSELSAWSIFIPVSYTLKHEDDWDSPLDPFETDMIRDRLILIIDCHAFAFQFKTHVNIIDLIFTFQ